MGLQQPPQHQLPQQQQQLQQQQQQHLSHMGSMIPPQTSFDKPTYQPEAHLGQYQHPSQLPAPQQQQYTGFNPQQQQQQQPGQFYQQQAAPKPQGYMGQQYATAQSNIQVFNFIFKLIF